MTDRALMQMALNALELGCTDSNGNEVDLVAPAITALRAALAEPEPEPVAYPEGDVVGPCICGSWPGGKCLKCPRTEPVPVVWMVFTQDGQSAYVTDNPTDIGDDQRALPLYTAPPTHSPLTDEEIDELPWCPSFEHPMTLAEGLRHFTRAIERAHNITGGNDE